MVELTRRAFLQSLAGLGLAVSFRPLRREAVNAPVQLPLPSASDLEDPLLCRIVDQAHPITEAEIQSAIEPNLVKLPLTMDGILVANENVRINQICLEGLNALFRDTNTAQTGLYVHSGFRSYEQQAIAYSQAKDKSTVLVPGTSQHHTGLAVDFTSSQIGKVVDIHSGFEETKAGKWVKEHAWEYGFIQSYLTNHDQIQNESWHYLYLGKPLAKTFITLKQSGWYGDVFLLQLAINLNMSRIEFVPEL
jgi:LAS superfamily LD-carboxypeptidase LdcB